MIYALSGKRGSGKTTAATHLMKKHGFIRVSFAEELRRLAKTLMPFKDNDLIVPSKKEAKFADYYWSPREFLVHFGEFMRFHDESYWLNRGLALCIDPHRSYVFDDCRYKNEADAIRKLGGKIIRINRYEKNNPYGKNLDTPSETNLDDYKFDFEVLAVRNTSITELQAQIDLAVS